MWKSRVLEIFVSCSTPISNVEWVRLDAGAVEAVMHTHVHMMNGNVLCPGYVLAMTSGGFLRVCVGGVKQVASLGGSIGGCSHDLASCRHRDVDLSSLQKPGRSTRGFRIHPVYFVVCSLGFRRGDRENVSLQANMK